MVLFVASSYINIIRLSHFHGLDFLRLTLADIQAMLVYLLVASLLIPTANCDRTCGCERETFRFLCVLVTIFLFKRVLSSGTSNSSSESLALSLSCRCSSSSEFSSSFCCSMNDVSAYSEQAESNPLNVSLK